MQYYRLVQIILIFSACLSCQDGKEKKIPPKAKRIASFKSLIKKETREKELLSEYGFFKFPLANLNPTDSVILYDLNTPLFSDYALSLIHI